MELEGCEAGRVDSHLRAGGENEELILPWVQGGLAGGEEICGSEKPNFL